MQNPWKECTSEDSTKKLFRSTPGDGEEIRTIRDLLESIETFRIVKVYNEGLAAFLQYLTKNEYEGLNENKESYAKYMAEEGVKWSTIATQID